MPKREEIRVITGLVEGAETRDGNGVVAAFAEDLAAISCGPYDEWVRRVEGVLGDCRSMRAREARGIQHPPAVPNPAEQRRRELESQIQAMQTELQKINQAEAA